MNHVRSGPLGWAQEKWLWREYLGRIPGEPGGGVIARVWPLPSGMGLEDLQSRLNDLVSRHELLRSVFVVTQEGIEQRVQAPGALRLEIRRIGTKSSRHAVIQETRRELVGRCSDISVEWPIQAIAVVFDDIPEYVGIGVHHIASDITAMEIIRRDLFRERPAGEDLRAVALQSLDRVEFERSPLGRRMSARALNSASDRLDRMPHRILPRRLELLDAEIRFMQYRIVSRAALHSVEILMRRYNASFSAVLLGVLGVLIGGAFGYRVVAFNNRSANRVRDEDQDLVTCLAQPSILEVRIDHSESFEAIVNRVSNECIRAYFHGAYSYFDFKGLLARKIRERGVYLPLGVSLNVRSIMNLKPASDEVKESDLLLAMEDTRLLMCPHPPQSRETELFFAASGDSHLDLSLVFDRASLEKRGAERLLLDVEKLLVNLVIKGCAPIGDVLSAMGIVPTTPGPEWMRVNNCWINRVSVERELLRFDGVKAAAVFLSTTEDGEARLVAYLDAGDAHVLAGEIDRFMMTRLRDHWDVMLPAEYHMFRNSPADLRRQDDWHRCTMAVLGEGVSRGDRHSLSIQEQALAVSIGKLNGLEHDISMDSGYHEQGGRFDLVPALVQELADLGLEGFDLAALSSGVPLSIIAASLRSHGQGSPAP